MQLINKGIMTLSIQYSILISKCRKYSSFSRWVLEKTKHDLENYKDYSIEI